MGTHSKNYLTRTPRDRTQPPPTSFRCMENMRRAHAQHEHQLTLTTSSPYTPPRCTRPQQVAQYCPNFRWEYPPKIYCISMFFLYPPLSALCPTFVRFFHLKNRPPLPPHGGTFRMKKSDKSGYISDGRGDIFLVDPHVPSSVLAIFFYPGDREEPRHAVSTWRHL